MIVVEISKSALSRCCTLEVGRYHLADIDTISIFLTQNIGDIDIALWPIHIFHYHQQISQ